jgi:DNA polymerase family A
MSQVGLSKNQTYVGNIIKSKVRYSEASDADIQVGLSSLYHDLDCVRPRVLMLHGDTALKGVLGYDKINKYRGSVYFRKREGSSEHRRDVESAVPELFANAALRSSAGYYGQPVSHADADSQIIIPAIHPKDVLREWSYLPLFIFDLRKVTRALKSPQSVWPAKAELGVGYDYARTLGLLRSLRASKRPFAFDIEGYVGAWTCCSLAYRQADGTILSFTVDFCKGSTSENEKVKLYYELKTLLEDPLCPKILQNCLYDSFVLGYDHRILIRGIVSDTMLRHWESHPELPKGLGTIGSIYTNEPYHKDEGRNADTHDDYLRYCAKDSVVTLIANETMEQVRTGHSHFQFNMRLLPAFLYMQMRGMRFDVAKRDNFIVRNELQQQLCQLQVMGLIGYPINVKSSQQMCKFLYEERGYEVILDRKTKNPTANETALLKLAEKHPTDHALRKLLEFRQIRTIGQILASPIDKDDRIRCGYNIVGADTGRVTCYASNTGNGYNLQTVTQELRCLQLADEGMHMFQCDLSGADAWTVAARCADLGDHTMLTDLRAGIKVAKVIALLFKYGASISRLSREELLERTNEISKNDPIYFGSKCVQHGTNYLMGPSTMSDTIFKQSGGTVSIPASVCRQLQAAYLSRYYGIPAWHRWLKEELRSKRGLTDASGHFRRFWGHPGNIETIKAAASHEPQANTTYATNLAAERLWYDPTNRMGSGRLVIQPLHQVHDALLGQFPIGMELESIRKIRTYFDNPLTCGRITFTIPFEGGYGPDWGTLPYKIAA